jgi:hypothetical protein
MNRAACIWGVAACVAAAIVCSNPEASIAAVIYVKADAGGANDGSSWVDAYDDLQAALAAAEAGDSVWVAVGTYKPTAGTDRAATFLMENGVALFGGFAGVETSVSERVMRFHRATLSGEIGLPAREDNSYHVLSALDVDSTAVIDGFVVRGGYASGAAPHDVGGGLIVIGGNPTVRNMWFDENAATRGGGACFTESRTTVVNAAFTRNYAAYGGAFSTDSESPKVGREVIVNTSMAGNTANTLGAAVYNVRSLPVVINSIVWANQGINQVVSLGGAVEFRYSDVEGSGGSGNWNSIIGIDGGNNIDVDPVFLSVWNGDVHLRPGSPVINIGDNAAPGLPPTDFDGEIRVMGGAVDIGADEYSDPTGVGERDESPGFRIQSVYPNPFNPTVTMVYNIDVRERVRVAVFDVEGRLVRVLHEGVENPGPHRAVWDAVDEAGRRAASGVYFMEVRSIAGRDHRKVILVK